MNTLDLIFKQHYGKLIALLINALKDVDLAEDCLQDAFVSALKHWSKNGVPKNPQAWLFTTAKHKALDKIRRDNNFEYKKTQYKYLLEINNDQNESNYSIPDERLRLIFTCCHPLLPENTAVALTLRLLGGLKTDEIASAFLLKPETMAQRIVRGKKKIKQADIAYVIPGKEEFDQRLMTVLKVLYLIYNAGYFTTYPSSIHNDLSNEAIRLARVLVKLASNHPDTQGLLALMLLNNSRKPARFSPENEFIPLKNHNRSLWDKKTIKQGINLLDVSLRGNHFGFYQLQAAISALHCEAESHDETDWQQIILLYDELIKINPSAIIKLNQLAAKSQVNSLIEVAKQLDKLEENLRNYQPFYATKADILFQLKKYKPAISAIKTAIKLCKNSLQRQYLVKQLNKIQLKSQ